MDIAAFQKDGYFTDGVNEEAVQCLSSFVTEQMSVVAAHELEFSELHTDIRGNLTCDGESVDLPDGVKANICALVCLAGADDQFSPRFVFDTRSKGRLSAAAIAMNGACGDKEMELYLREKYAERGPCKYTELDIRTLKEQTLPFRRIYNAVEHFIVFARGQERKTVFFDANHVSRDYGVPYHVLQMKRCASKFDELGAGESSGSAAKRICVE